LPLSSSLRKYRFTEGGNAGWFGTEAVTRRFWDNLGMTDRTGRRESGAGSVILLLLLFDIDGYLKGYVGGLVVCSIERLAYRLSRGDPMMRVSASLFVWFTRVEQQAEMIAWSFGIGRQMCKVRRQG
ncbi:hypothetical protein, partial [Paracoccus sediminis]|uniref:hypothetical protein n=1 Tax=Paracoccus sediminis TaxID=1214787 RepID=UPI001A91C162